MTSPRLPLPLDPSAELPVQLADQRLDISLFNPRLDAGLVAIAVMLASRSMLAAMSVGMAAFLLLRAVL